MAAYPLRAALLLSQSKEAVHIDEHYAMRIKRVGEENVELTVSQGDGGNPFVREPFTSIEACEHYLKQNELPVHRGWTPQELAAVPVRQVVQA